MQNHNDKLFGPTEFDFYIIKSSEAISKIKETIEVYRKKVENEGHTTLPTCLVRPIWSRKRETDNTLCVMDAKIVKVMNEEGEYLKPVEKCRVSKFNAPREGETHNLYVELPRILTFSQCQDKLDELIDDLVLYKVWNKEELFISYPGKSRNRDEHGGKVYIYFGKKNADNVDDKYIQKIALTRMFIGGRYWDDVAEPRIKCYWKREDVYDRKPNKGDNHYTSKAPNSRKPVKLPSVRLRKQNSTNITHVKNMNKSQSLVVTNGNSSENAWKTPLKISSDAVDDNNE